MDKGGNYPISENVFVKDTNNMLTFSIIYVSPLASSRLSTSG